MGNLCMKRSDTHSSNGTNIQPGNLKLESQKVVEVMGKMDKWQRWKSRTECTFDGSGYERVLINAIYDVHNIYMNQLVKPQLELATVGGTVQHLVK